MAGSGSAARSKTRRGSSKKAQKAAQNAQVESKVAESASSSSKKTTVVHETTGVVGIFDKIKKFLVSVKGEMERCTWPSMQELRAATVVVLVTLILVSAYMGLVNKVFSWIFSTPESTGL